MKEQLYTIPLNDAVDAKDECPFCFIERSVEQDLIDFVLGSSASYMEADVREMTDKAGFCRTHFQKMFDYGNTLGNAWILKLHAENGFSEDLELQIRENGKWMKTDQCAKCKMWRYCQGNGMHLRDGEGKLQMCQYNMIVGNSR